MKQVKQDNHIIAYISTIVLHFKKKKKKEIFENFESFLPGVVGPIPDPDASSSSCS